MAKNAEYVVKDPAAVDKLGRQLVFSNLAKCVRPRFARASRPSTAIDSPGATRAPPPRVRAAAPAGPNPPPFCQPGPTSPFTRGSHPHPSPPVDRLPGMVEAAQGEMKVVQQKWANRMELPMTEVRAPSRRDFRTPRGIAPTRSRRGTVLCRAPFPEPEPRRARGAFAGRAEATERLKKQPPKPRPPAPPLRRSASPLSSPRRCTRGSASGRWSVAAAASPATERLETTRDAHCKTSDPC